MASIFLRYMCTDVLSLQWLLSLINVTVIIILTVSSIAVSEGCTALL